ncbi:sulfotransferase [Mycobacterium marinum]|uniref:sulfotransferase n=1 Tax=Mycobacterium marinum TaxID=1781 RepID=UPI000B977422|nr:sulfotransferase [Mycobacterium marinum]
MIPFVILTQPRSGSQHLVNLLNTHPNIICHDEILNPGYRHGHHTDNLDEHNLFNTMFVNYPNPDNKTNPAAIGWKILGGHLNYRPFTFKNLLNWPNIHIIVLERQNQLECIRSEAQAITRRRWKVTKPPKGQLPTVHLDPTTTLRWLRESHTFYTQLRGIPNHMHWLHYEDLRDNQTATLAPLWPFLKVEPPGPIKTNTYRQETRTLAETITNLDEIRATLAGTKYEHLASL